MDEAAFLSRKIFNDASLDSVLSYKQGYKQLISYIYKK